MIARELQALCPHTVGIEPWSSTDAYSKPTYTTSVEYTCLIVKQPKMVRTVTGQEKVSSAQVYLTSAPTLTVKDRVTLPDGTKPVILSIDTFPDTRGDYFSVLYL